MVLWENRMVEQCELLDAVGCQHQFWQFQLEVV